MSARNIVIPVMGACGAGKSTFVNALLQEERTKVVRVLSPSTNAPLPISVPDKLGVQCSGTLWLVETPGFDGTTARDLSVLEEIGKWITKIHDERSVIGGIIYLHDISEKRFESTTKRNLDIFNKICGESALRRIVLATTNWPERSEPSDATVMREKDLIDNHWAGMVKKGSRAGRFIGTPESAKKLVEMALQGLETGDTLLDIQKELVLEKKNIRETQAGKQLCASIARNAESEKNANKVLKGIRNTISRLFSFLQMRTLPM